MSAPLIEESLETSLQGKNWRAQARCADLAGTLTGLFFSEELQDIAQAKAICAECPVMAPCLAGALGFPNHLRAQLHPIVEMDALIEERTGAKPGTVGGFFTLNPRVDELPDL